ncbi:MAG: hypothetical protein ACI3XI_00425 [Eubacteriales bacterium]
MAYHLGTVSRVDDSIYFTTDVSTNNGMYVLATEYGAINFDAYVPCFNPVCDHTSRSTCCVALSRMVFQMSEIVAFKYKGEPALVVFNQIDSCLSLPYSNIKVNLVYEDFLDSDSPSEGYREWESSPSKPKRNELLVYKDYFYYVETRNGVRVQYRISLEGGEPERVFEEDNVIIRTIINDRFYGIKYDVDDWTPEQGQLPTRDQIHYFRSDMNYENVEPLPEKLQFFSLFSDIATNDFIILDADGDYIYTKRGTKILAFSDSDIYAEPILISDTEGKIPTDLPSLSIVSRGYSDGIIFSVINSGLYNRMVYDYSGTMTKNPQWYESSTLYSFDIRTGECRVLDMSDQKYLLEEVYYADDKYVYGRGSYVHDDNRCIQSVNIRLTLDTMRYEVLLPDYFREYSPQS